MQCGGENISAVGVYMGCSDGDGGVGWGGVGQDCHGGCASMAVMDTDDMSCLASMPARL